MLFFHVRPKLTRASSGSLAGSKSPSLDAGAPSSPAIIAEEMRASASIGPGGTVTRWLDVPSLPFRVFIKVVKLPVFIAWGKKSIPHNYKNAKLHYAHIKKMKRVVDCLYGRTKYYLFSKVDNININFFFL